MCDKVLVIDDEESIREVLTLALEIEGFRVQRAANGKEGIALLQDDVPCLILLDLMMPVMNGWEFLQKVKGDARFSEIPIVAVTAFAANAREFPLDGTIEKPLDLENLVNTVKRFCKPRESEGGRKE